MVRAVSFCLVLLSAILVADFSYCQSVSPIPVELKQTDGRWELFRGGKPYFIKGAGGDGPLDLLARSGGNSTRTWGVGPDTMKRLDEAHANGISVAIGIWLEHESRGFDYQDYEQVTSQIEKALATVRKYKNHPAVLLWGVGNEMEGFGSGDNPAIWSHVEHLCRLIKQEDPNHPTMTVVAEIGGNKIAALHQFCPSLDIVGINSYGGAASVPQRYKERGGTKPFIVTEFGPLGPWEVGRDNINAVMEPNSNARAQKYRESYLGITADKTHCLGTYAFLWGQKMEATITWFGMLLEDDRMTNMAITMSELWSGKPAANRAPEIASFKIENGNEVKPGEAVCMILSAKDPDGDPIKVQWRVYPEADAYLTAGDYKPNPDPIEGSIIEANSTTAKIKAPQKSGFYRVYCVVDDGKDCVATASIPIKVEFQSLQTPGKKTEIPILVYDEPETASIFGDFETAGEEGFASVANCNEGAKFGNHCVQLKAAANSSGSMRFTSPEGFDLMGCKRMYFWAKGTTDNDSVVVGIGGQADTFSKRKTVPLTRFWKKYQIDFANSDLRRISNGFSCRLEPSNSETQIYLDKITIE